MGGRQRRSPVCGAGRALGGAGCGQGLWEPEIAGRGPGMGGVPGEAGAGAGGRGRGGGVGGGGHPAPPLRGGGGGGQGRQSLMSGRKQRVWGEGQLCGQGPGAQSCL